MHPQVIVVSPYSLRWSNIASVRWEALSRNLSLKYKVTFMTSSFQEKDKDYERNFDIGKSELVEIPLKFYQRNPYSTSFKNKEKRNTSSSFFRRIKAEARIFLERVLPVSSGGMLYHDLGAYKKEIDIRINNAPLTILITTYDPWFSLRLGSFFKKRYPKKVLWIADFRDPSFNVHESFVSRLPFFKSDTRMLLSKADAILVVTKTMKEEYEKLLNREVFFLPNGYDDLSNLVTIPTTYNKLRGSLKITYTGSLHPKSREIKPFVEVLKIMRGLNPSIKIHFIYAGFQYDEIQLEFSKHGIQHMLQNKGLIKKEESILLQRDSDILLLIVYTGDNENFGKSIRTGKVYEYLASGKPIIAIAPHCWEMREEIEADGISKVFDKNEIQNLAEYLVELAMKTEIKIDHQNRIRIVNKYLYRNLAMELDELICRLLKDYKS